MDDEEGVLPPSDDAPPEEVDQVEVAEPGEPEPEPEARSQFPGDDEIDRYEQEEEVQQDQFTKATGVTKADYESSMRELEMLRTRQQPYPPHIPQQTTAQAPQPRQAQQQEGRPSDDDEEVVLTHGQLRQMEGRMAQQMQANLQQSLATRDQHRETADIVEGVLDRYGPTQKGSAHRNTAREMLFTRLSEIRGWDEATARRESRPIIAKLRRDMNGGQGQSRQRPGSPPVGGGRGGGRSGQKPHGLDPTKPADKEKLLEMIEEGRI